MKKVPSEFKNIYKRWFEASEDKEILHIKWSKGSFSLKIKPEYKTILECHSDCLYLYLTVKLRARGFGFTDKQYEEYVTKLSNIRPVKDIVSPKKLSALKLNSVSPKELEEILNYTTEFVEKIRKIIEKPKPSGVRIPPTSMEKFISSLEQSCSSDEVNLVYNLIEKEMPQRGCIIEFRSNACKIKLPDPKGSKQLIILFGIDKDGFICIGWLVRDLNILGVPTEIADDYKKNTEALFENFEVRTKSDSFWSIKIKLNEVKAKYDDFMKVLDNTITRIKIGQ